MKTKRLPKSGNVTIKLSPKEVRELLKSTYTGYQEPAARKLLNAVRSKFSNVEAELEARKHTANIVHELWRTEEWRTANAQFHEERQEVDKLYTALSEREATAFQELAQAKLDEAGIKSYRAERYSFVRVDEEV